jgi:hypothetical protein
MKLVWQGANGFWFVIKNMKNTLHLSNDDAFKLKFEIFNVLGAFQAG